MSAAVVRLPTAVPRKVKQRWNKHTRALLEQLPKFPDERTMLARRPWMREALKKARLIQQIEPTPAMLIATAMFRALPELEQLKVQALVALMALKNPDAQRVAEWLEYIGGMMCVGECGDIRRALEMLASGEVK